MTPIPSVMFIRTRLIRLGKALSAALVLIFAACSDYGDRLLDPADNAGQESVPLILTIDATKGRTADTRGLNLPNDNSDIAAIWSEGDKVTVMSAYGVKIGTMTPMTYGSYQTKLTATLTSTVKKGDQLNLVFPRTGRDYTGQKGTLANIATNYDYATTTVTVQYVKDNFVSATDAHFKNQQAIVRFTLKKEDNSDLSVKNLTIEADGLIQNGETRGPVTITPNDPTNQIYAALSGLNGVVTLTATDGNKTYAYVTPEPKTLDNGNFYRVNCQLKATPVAYPDPLTLECFDSKGCAVSVANYGDLEYKKNDGDWKKYQRQVNLNKGDKVSFRGNEATNTSTSKYMQISCNGNCYVYGNVMSLISKDGYATMTNLPYSNTFQNLFQGNTNIYHDNGKDLVLPATKLRNQCYYNMFNGCTNLNYIKCLATDISAKDCTTNWLKSTAKKGTFVKAEGVTWTEGDSGIPNGWTVEKE